MLTKFKFLRGINNEWLRWRNAGDSANVNVIKLNGSDNAEMGVDLDMGANEILNLAAPTTAASAATRQYVLDQVALAASSFSVKELPARVASTANVTVSSAPASIDGVTLSVNDRVLLKDQSSAAENGIYIFNGAASALTRSTDADNVSELDAGFMIAVTEGTTNADTLWMQASPTPTTLGTDPLSFVKVGPSVSVTLPVWEKQNFTLAGGDITNQYVDLTQVAHTDSVMFVVDGLTMAEGSDYTISYTGGAGGKTRLSFAGDLATGGASALVAGDIVRVQYQY